MSLANGRNQYPEPKRSRHVRAKIIWKKFLEVSLPLIENYFKSSIEGTALFGWESSEAGMEENDIFHDEQELTYEHWKNGVKMSLCRESCKSLTQFSERAKNIITSNNNRVLMSDPSNYRRILIWECWSIICSIVINKLILGGWLAVS